MNKSTINNKLAILSMVVISIFYCLSSNSYAEITPGPNDVFVRVIDCGAALCCVVKMPENKYMIYDAGNYEDGEKKHPARSRN
jgi:hypothetical protein